MFYLDGSENVKSLWKWEASIESLEDGQFLALRTRRFCQKDLPKICITLKNNARFLLTERRAGKKVRSKSSNTDILKKVENCLQ